VNDPTQWTFNGNENIESNFGFLLAVSFLLLLLLLLLLFLLLLKKSSQILKI